MTIHDHSMYVRRHFYLWVLLASLLIPAFLIGCSSGGDGTGTAPPDLIFLPDGFRPEGIAISEGKLYVGSIPTGRIYRADLATGQGEVIVAGQTGRNAIGIKIDDRGRIFVAGGSTGKAHVYDAAGADIAEYTLAQGVTFINDVVLTSQAAWFTDSRNPVLYRVEIFPDGSLGQNATALSVSGDIQIQTGATNLNGIAATPGGSTLLVIQSNTGKLFSVNTGTGIATSVDLAGESLPGGDGILLQGQTLYVVQNQSNLLAVLQMAEDFSSAQVLKRVTDPDFDVPTTVAASDGSLYLVNARFNSVPDADTATYTVVRIEKP